MNTTSAPKMRSMLSQPAPDMLPPKPGRTRLAVFGGSFNPVHNGHLFLAGEVIRRGLADEVIFVPAGIPPHKPCDGLLPGAVRLALLEEAVKPFPEFSVSDIELQQPDTPSYTITTLDMLRAAFPGREISFLMGMDCLAELHTWHRAEELAAQFSFLVYPRPDVAVPKAPELADRFGNRNALKLLAGVMDAPLLPISSSQIRTLCAEGKSLAGLVPADVIRLIGEQKLYAAAAE
jgi:nicotinate-nucleotide adenylyltransferase